MKYLDYINKQLLLNLSKEKKSFVFGQNINSGTFISGLTKNINIINNLKVHNTPNCEYSMLGLGFGFIISGGEAIYFAKQLDFMLLGCDHYVNTLNAIKNNNQRNGKFKVILFVCDQGFQGSQSSFNNIDDLSSLAQFDTFQINTKFETDKVIKHFFKLKGFQILSIGQRLSKSKLFDAEPTSYSRDFSFIEYFVGKNTLIISSNFAFEYAVKLKSKLEKNNKKKIGLINSNYVVSPDIGFLRKIIKKRNYKKLIFITDTKSINKRSFKIELDLALNIKTKHIFRKNFNWAVQKDDLPDYLLDA
jgi:hypothetical protein